MGTQPPSQEVDGAPAKFSAHVYCGQTAAWIKMPLGTEVGHGPDDIVLDGDRAPLPKKGQSPLPNFRLVSIVAKQLDRWIKVALGMEVGLGSGHIMLDGHPAPLSKKGAETPNFRPIFIVAKRLDASRCQLVWRPQPRRLCVRWGPSYSQKKGTPTPPNFCPMSIVAKRLDG